jgi:choline transport protein
MRTQNDSGDHGEAVEMSPQSYSTTTGVELPGSKEVHTVEANSLEEASKNLSATKSTPSDNAGMRRMGKEQQLVRHFRLLSVTSFTALSVAAWEIGLFLVSPGLINGGRAGLMWSSLWCILGFGPVYISMAEMASMAPIAGAQYHWVSEFAPESCQRVLSYITGFV